MLGFVGFFGYAIVFVLTLTTNFMIESETLHAWGTFWIFSGMSLLATVWCAYYLKETQGLSDREKKSLYLPKHLQGNKGALLPNKNNLERELFE